MSAAASQRGQDIDNRFYLPELVFYSQQQWNGNPSQKSTPASPQSQASSYFSPLVTPTTEYNERPVTAKRLPSESQQSESETSDSPPHGSNENREELLRSPITPQEGQFGDESVVVHGKTIGAPVELPVFWRPKRYMVIDQEDVYLFGSQSQWKVKADRDAKLRASKDNFKLEKLAVITVRSREDLSMFIMEDSRVPSSKSKSREWFLTATSSRKDARDLAMAMLAGVLSKRGDGTAIPHEWRVEKDGTGKVIACKCYVKRRFEECGQKLWPPTPGQSVAEVNTDFYTHFGTWYCAMVKGVGSF
jgi:hypothetical protein